MDIAGCGGGALAAWGFVPSHMDLYVDCRIV